MRATHTASQIHNVAAAIETLRTHRPNNLYRVFPWIVPTEQDLADVEALLWWRENREAISTEGGATQCAFVLWGWLVAHRA